MKHNQIVLFHSGCAVQATEDIPEVQRFAVHRSPSAPPQAGGLHPASSTGTGVVKKTVTRTVHTKEYDMGDQQGAPLPTQVVSPQQADIVGISPSMLPQHAV